LLMILLKKKVFITYSCDRNSQHDSISSTQVIRKDISSEWNVEKQKGCNRSPFCFLLTCLVEAGGAYTM